MAEYTKDRQGVVHVCNTAYCAGEFTFCDREYAISDGPYGEFLGVPVGGPATCKDCKEKVHSLRSAMSGARFK